MTWVAVLVLELLAACSGESAEPSASPATEPKDGGRSPPESYWYPSQPHSLHSGPPELAQDDHFRASTLHFGDSMTEKTTVLARNGRTIVERRDAQGVLRRVEIREPGTALCVRILFDDTGVLRQVDTNDERTESSPPDFRSVTIEPAGWCGYHDEHGRRMTDESGVLDGKHRSNL